MAALPRVGDCWKLDVAEVMKLRPDLVIGSAPFRAAVVAKIIEQPAAFLSISPRNLAGIRSDIRLLGRLANRGTGREAHSTDGTVICCGGAAGIANHRREASGVRRGVAQPDGSVSAVGG